MNKGFWAVIFILMTGLANAQVAKYAGNQLFFKLKDNYTKDIPLFEDRKSFSLSKPIVDSEIKTILGIFESHKVVGNKKTSKIPSPKLNRIYTITVSDTSKIIDLIIELSKLPFIDYVERVPMYSTEYTPNDLSPNQWNLTKTKIPEAWDLSKGLSTVVIAIVDDAVRLNHEDLAANIWVNPKEIPNNGRDDDNNGYIDDINGYDVADNDNNPTTPSTATNSEFTHGTHCAGIASARTDNSRGIASPGFSCKIMAVKTKQNADRGLTLPFAYDGLEYAISSGAANVISLSWGGYGRANTFQLLIDYAYSKGIVIVAAAGNSNTNTPFYPASYNHVISVGATDINDQRAFFSNYGTTIDIMAPGLNIWSTLAGSTSSYGYLSGTSMACPLVSGICGLMLSYAPGSSPDFIESCLKSNADNINGLNPGYVGQLGAGRVNAQGALACLRGIPVADFLATTTSICVGQSVAFYDKSLGNAIYAWNWTFSGTNISRSTLRNPTVTYLSPGTYPVSLTVTNNGGSNTITKQRYITVYQPTASISGSATISAGQSTPLRFDFSGNIPYTVAFSDGTAITSLSGINSSPYFAYVSPTVTRTYTISSFSDGSCSGSKNGIAIISVSTVTSPCQNCTTNTGLVGYYPFCGNANDVSGNNNTGTVTGAMLGTDRFGNQNSSYAFNGVNQSIDIGNKSSLKMANGLSISLWIKPTIIPTSGLYNIISDHAPGEAVDGIGKMMRFAEEELQFHIDGVFAFGTAIYAKYNFPNSSANSWHHIVGTYDRNKVKLYVNGNLVDSVNHSNALAINTNPLLIGRSGYGEYFNGQIDDIRIFNRALTANEVAGYFSEPALCTSTGLVASYPFCGNANDVSGNNYNGTVTGAVLTTDRFGNANSAYFFNGSVTPAFDNNIKFNAPYGNTKTAFSISIWAKSDADIASVREYPTMANFYNNDNLLIGENARLSWVSMVLGTAYAPNLWGMGSFVQFPQGGGNTKLNTTTVPAVNVWNHYVFTYNPTTNVMQIYLNGNLNNVNSISGISNPNLFNSLIIGREYDGGNNDYSATFFKGALDDIKIYSRVLNPTEVLTLFNEAPPCTTTGLVASYPFCGNANDVSGNNFTGTVSGATLTSDKFGNPNSAYNFNGVDSYIRLKNTDTLNLNRQSFSFWIYNAGNTVSGIINKWSNKGFAWAVDLVDNNIWYFINSGGPTNLLQSSQNIPINTWSHIVVSYDNDSLRLYINGVLTDKKKIVQNIVNRNYALIGKAIFSSIS